MKNAWKASRLPSNVRWCEWLPKHQMVFETIKSIVTSRECLASIDHENMRNNKIFVTTDASDRVSGAVLSFRPTWE